MSRCYPYPPPGYSLNKSSNHDASLIESIKLQREKEKAKAERKKEKKREKKEKRHEKKEKSKHKSTDDCVYHGKGHSVNEKCVESKYGNSNKVTEYELEQVERSNLTEEHGQPMNLQNPSYSSDSSQNSKKRKRPTSSPSVGRTHGNIIRIKLPQRHIERDISSERNPQCTTSSRRQVPVQPGSEVPLRAGPEDISSTQRHIEHDVCSGRNQLCDKARGPEFPVLPGSEVPLRAGPEEVCSTSQGVGDLVEKHYHITARRPNCVPPCKTEKYAQGNDEAGAGSYTADPVKRSVELQYRDLVENWVAPNPNDLDFKDEDADEDWLFCKKQRSSHVNRESGVKNGVSSFCSTSLWPRAQYLQEADIYALPFTVPF